MIDRYRNRIIIFVIHHPPEGISRQFPEFVKIRTAVNIHRRAVNIKQFSIAGGFVNEKPSGHMASDLFYYRKCFII